MPFFTSERRHFIMYAVIKTGGKQYKVAKDDVLTVEKLSANAGDSVSLDEVLMVGAEGDLKVGSPTVSGASVKAEILEQTRGDKIVVFKKHRRKHYRRKNGHRQELSKIRVTEIVGAGKAKKAAPKKAAAEKTEE